MARKVMVVGSAAALVLIVLLVGVVGFLALTIKENEGLADTSNQFMTLLKNHDIMTAYGMVTGEFKQGIERQSFEDVFMSRNISNWSFGSPSKNGSGATLSGEVTIDNKIFKIELNWIKQDAGNWALASYTFTPELR